MKKCPHCSAAIQDDASSCPICRMSLVAGPGMPGAPGAPPPGAPPASYAPVDAPTSGKAVGSLICGILGFIILPVISAIPAIILGHLSLSEIKRSAGRIKGQGMAIAGLVLGYLSVALIPFILIIAAIAIPNLLRAKVAANEASAVGALRSYNTAMTAYASMCPKQGYASSARNLGPGSGDCSAANLVDGTLGSDDLIRSGYRFHFAPGSLDAEGRVASYSVTADPAVPGSTGVRHFYTDQTGTIRVSLRGPADPSSRPVM